jgi:NNP family nitrate/nitrite transporter-like MFS transporter
MFGVTGVEATERALVHARRDSAAVIGISSAIGALGGFFIPQALKASVKATGSIGGAFSAFVVVYVFCILTTWWYYRRKSFLVARIPSLAQANA